MPNFINEPGLFFSQMGIQVTEPDPSSGATLSESFTGSWNSSNPTWAQTNITVNFGYTLPIFGNGQLNISATEIYNSQEHNIFSGFRVTGSF
jgi:hypothetical protein